MKQVLAVIVAVMLMAGGCGAASSSNVDEVPKGEVVASIFPLFDAATFLGGERLHVTNLAPLDPFAPLSDAQERKLRDAGLAIILGGGTQPDVERIVAERSGPTLRVLDQMQTKVYPVASGTDPHVWLSPQAMAMIVTLVQGALNEFDPAGVDLYAKNSERTRHSLAIYDKRLTATLATCQRRDVVTTDARFQYLTDSYGLRQLPVSGEDEIRTAVRRTRATTIYMDHLPSIEKANEMEKTLGVRVSTLDPLTTLTDQARRGGGSYWSVMDINLAALRAGLDCQDVKVKSL